MDDPIIIELMSRTTLNLGCAIPLEYYEEWLTFMDNLMRKARDNHLYYDSTNIKDMPDL